MGYWYKSAPGIFIFLMFVFVLVNNSNEVFSERTNSTKLEGGFKSLESSKIHPIITEWKTSPEPQVFALENDLQYSDGKIRVYLYLDDSESISKLPTDIDLVSSSGNIAVAHLDSREITQLSQLDFVQRIEPPVSGTFMVETNLQKTIPDDYSVKIAELIQQWQASPNPATFALENVLQYSDGKIRVYIYLDSYESVTNLPNDIDFLVSSDNIVVAFLDSQEINQIAKLDFVQRIELPVSGTFDPPLIADTGSIDEIFLYSITAIIIAAVVLGTVFVSRRRKIAKKF